MLAVGLCYSKENCELIKKVDEIGYTKFNIMCQETPGFDSVMYEIHLAYHEIDQIWVTKFKGEKKYEDYHTIITFEVKEPYCEVVRDTLDEYGVITGISENYYSTALCERRFRYVWNKLKKLGTYK
jgi:hypothetical protein